MDLSNLLQLGASAILHNSDQATNGLDSNELVSALSGLLGGGGGNLNLGAILSKMQQSGLGDIAASWLGNGANAPISPGAVTDLIGSDKIADFASRFGLSEESAKNAIASALPEMVDKASPNGSLLEGLIGSIGGLGGLSNMVNKFF
ncbi:DUF937 domain-containing protein [Chlorobaculum thiosulfatiphilum]|jgi:uncharacterized protein YidB (DUF937 family)|uniref:DUF937 domain-containing protein n=1 Tax=Chlorobaculum thiosulfatiphilum TaxID=115852 RepID=A0A5C4S754_CHLTI|nr:YidB family protein [Chlorobaculum thiosulfatiphilum]TNJ39276.1 DUF937 domain-containing protein [Chlorobaculum thiosulfatiphilum]